jgi:hypothetical protein
LAAAPRFDLTAVTPGGTAQGALNNCAGVTAIGVSCSPLIGGTFVSPFVLTNRGAYTDVSLGVSLLGHDSTGTTTQFAGGFTTQVISQLIGGNQVRLDPDAIQTFINGGGVINNTYSGTFTGSAVVPEPAAIVLLGSGMLLIAVGLRKRKTLVQ